MKAFKYCIISISFLLLACNGFSQVKLSEKMVEMPTYKVLPAEKAPVFFTGEKFQGASRYTYPLALNDQISSEKTYEKWKFLELENEYIKLGVTPEIGGKLYYATDKTSNYNFIYKNKEVKPGIIGMTGAWVSGGIEWCVFHHHRASTFLPMDYSTAENADGSKTIFVGETEPRHGMRWTAGITVHPGKSYFEAEVSIYNPTPNKNTFLYWANVATHTNENYQTIFPPSVQLATFHSKTEFTHWPVSTTTYRGTDYGPDGTDISWWKNVKNSASFFAHDLQEDFMGGYDHGKQTGTVHIAHHNIVKGAKLWEWGSGPRGQATEGRLTETSGPYVEIMVGAYSDNQPDYTWIMPYETKRWKHYWYPVKDIQGFKNANINAAVNLEKRDDNKVFLGYYSTQKLENVKIVLKNKNEIIFTDEIEISPEKSFAREIEIPDSFKLTDLFTEMVNPAKKEQIIAYQPEKFEKPDLPPVVESPLLPEEIESIEELYLTGKRIEQFYNPGFNELDYFHEVLKRDPGDIRTNTTLGRKELLNGNYAKAGNYLSTAIKRITRDYTRPETCEALYLQGLVLKALGLYEEAIDTLYRATWDYAWHSAAYFELAQISCKKGDYKMALEQINESLSTNTKNNRAVALKAAILRKTGAHEDALKIIDRTIQTDPLNFRLLNEKYLLEKALSKTNAEKTKEDVRQKMRDFDQNYLNLALEYLKDGMPLDAKAVLLRFENQNPIIAYYLGYIEDESGNSTGAESWFEKANDLSEDYCFPFRLETVPVLKKALEYNSADGKALYYLGNIFYDKQPGLAMEYFQKSLTAEPTLAMAWRNLGWGNYRYLNRMEEAVSCYERAIELNDEEAIFYAELDNLYELNNTPASVRLKLFNGKNDVVSRRDDAFIQQIKVLTLAGRAEKAVEYLAGKSFNYREGSSQVREIIIDANLALGIKYFNNTNYKQALEQFLAARVQEEEAGSARFGNRNIQVNYFIAAAYQKLGKKSKANEHFQKAAGIETNRIGIMNYYQGMSYLALNKNKEAQKVFNEMIDRANEQISGEGQADFFAIFGEQEQKNIRLSVAHTLIGLANKGLGNMESARAELQKAVELWAGNLWASIEM